MNCSFSDLAYIISLNFFTLFFSRMKSSPLVSLFSFFDSRIFKTHS